RQRVVGAEPVAARAGLGDVAYAARRTALGARRSALILGAARRGSVAHLGDIARIGRLAADRAPRCAPVRARAGGATHVFEVARPARGAAWRRFRSARVRRAARARAVADLR